MYPNLNKEKNISKIAVLFNKTSEYKKIPWYATRKGHLYQYKLLAQPRNHVFLSTIQVITSYSANTGRLKKQYICTNTFNSTGNQCQLFFTPITFKYALIIVTLSWFELKLPAKNHEQFLSCLFYKVHSGFHSIEFWKHYFLGTQSVVLRKHLRENAYRSSIGKVYTTNSQ